MNRGDDAVTQPIDRAVFASFAMERAEERQVET